jgi:UDP-N-acetylglucosamine 2-epimerase (non-hydrolysing)
MKVLLVAGARPNFMKVAPIMREMEAAPAFVPRLVHTGQHYDADMSAVFFGDLGIREPDWNLEVGSGDRLEQIDRIMTRFEPLVASERPDAMLVVGDVTSTVACARVAKSHDVLVIHVEAGLRSFDSTMPEELNRVETDQLSDLLFVTEPSGMRNLENERISGSAHLVGNVMIDSLVQSLPKARALGVAARFGLTKGGYVVSTFHRPSNVDDKQQIEGVVELLRFIAERRPVVLPLHPRTRASLERHELLGTLESASGVHLTTPLGYLEFLSLVADCEVVVTDSGGIQEETTYLQVPCITMRDNTERPITCEIGSNTLAGASLDQVRQALESLWQSGPKPCAVPELWDGNAAKRIVQILADS